MGETVKHTEAFSSNKRLIKHIEERVKIVEKSEYAENIQEFEKIITSIKKTVWLAYRQGIISGIFKKHMKTIREI